MSAEVAELLERAMKRIEDPRAWTRGALARNADGQGANVVSPSAVCWCAMGAVRCEGGYDSVAEAARDALCASADAMGAFDHNALSAVELNDTRTHADVMEMFRRAIARERAAQ
jgi:hypothetical protein